MILDNGAMRRPQSLTEAGRHSLRSHPRFGQQSTLRGWVGLNPLPGLAIERQVTQ
jgi:hypothetical protein